MASDISGKTLAELDGQDWGEPNFCSYVVVNCHRLRHVPLREFTVEDLRLMVGQGISLEYLMPLALEHLRHDPLAEGNFFPGDLLAAILRQEETFWRENPVWHAEIQAIINTLPAIPQEIKQAVLSFNRMNGSNKV